MERIYPVFRICRVLLVEVRALKIELRNIGAIGNAEIELDGITVIAGINNKGKSTVGKALFALLNEMDEWNKTYQRIRANNINAFLIEHSTSLEDYCMDISKAKRRRTAKANQLIRRFAEDEDFVAAIEDFQVQGARGELMDFFQKYFTDYLSLYIKKEMDVNEIQNSEKNDAWFDTWINEAIPKVETIELDELVLQRKSIQESFKIVL